MVLAPSLAPVHAMLGVCLLLAFLLLSQCVQRLYYRVRTSSLDAVDTMHLSFFRDGLVMVPAMMFMLLSISLLMVRHQAMSFESLVPGTAVRGFEVADASESGMTLVVHQTFDSLEPRRSSIIVSDSNTFSVEVEVLRFGPVLRWLGQNDLVRVNDIQTGDTTTPSAPVILEPGFFRRLFLDHQKIEVIHSPPGLQRGSLLDLVARADGTLGFAPRFLD